MKYLWTNEGVGSLLKRFDFALFFFFEVDEYPALKMHPARRKHQSRIHKILVSDTVGLLQYALYFHYVFYAVYFLLSSLRIFF